LLYALTRTASACGGRALETVLPSGGEGIEILCHCFRWLHAMRLGPRGSVSIGFFFFALAICCELFSTTPFSPTRVRQTLRRRGRHPMNCSSARPIPRSRHNGRVSSSRRGCSDRRRPHQTIEETCSSHRAIPVHDAFSAAEATHRFGPIPLVAVKRRSAPDYPAFRTSYSVRTRVINWRDLAASIVRCGSHTETLFIDADVRMAEKTALAKNPLSASRARSGRQFQGPTLKLTR